MDPKISLTVTVDPEVRRALKYRSADTGIGISADVNAILRDALGLPPRLGSMLSASWPRQKLRVDVQRSPTVAATPVIEESDANESDEVLAAAGFIFEEAK
jgi:plasmid stability protein